MILLVVVEVEEVGGCEAFARANVVRGLFADGLEVLVFLLCSFELGLSVGFLCSRIAVYHTVCLFFIGYVVGLLCLFDSPLGIPESPLMFLAVGIDVSVERTSIGLVASRRGEPVEVSDIVRAVVDEEFLALLGQ